MAANLPKHESEHTTWYACQGCEKRFLGWTCAPRKYCDRSCASTHQNKGGKTDVRACFQRKYGDDWVEHYDAWRDGISRSTSGEKNPRYGKPMSEAGKQKSSQAQKGRKLEDIHNPERAAQIRARISECVSGEKNPAFGKVYSDGGKSVKGYYKGKFFRSLLEYSFMKHLETRGFSLDTDVLYESFRIPYTLDGKPGTYHIDFHVVPENVVYEVKPSYVVKNPPARQLAKWEAARVFCAERGLEFKVVTDKEFPKIGFKDAYDGDTEVKWDERTFKYFKAARDPLGRNRANGKNEYCQGLI